MTRKSDEAFATVGDVSLCYDTFGDPSDRAMLLVMGLASQMILWDADRPFEGVIYAGKTATKLAEHGGFGPNDLHVGLLVSYPGAKSDRIAAGVETTEIAPTIWCCSGSIHAISRPSGPSTRRRFRASLRLRSP